MKPNEMSYLDHLAKQTGNYKKAQEIIKTSQDPLYGIGTWIKKNRDQSQMKKPIYFKKTV